MLFLFSLTDVLAAELVSVGAPYQITVTPGAAYEVFQDSTGPEVFSAPHVWYKGELTDGVAGMGYWDAPMVQLPYDGRLYITIDLGDVVPITRIDLGAIGGGLYGIFLPARVAVEVLEAPGEPLSYAEFCAGREPDGQSWTLLGEISHTLTEDGSSLFLHTLSLETEPTSARLVRLAITPVLAYDTARYSGFFDEVSIFAEQAPSSSDEPPELVESPPDGGAFPLDLSEPAEPLRSFDDFLLGAHVTIIDLGKGIRPVMYEIIADEPAGMRAEGVAALRDAGVTTLRFYDTYWLNLRSHIENYQVLNQLGGYNYTVPETDDALGWPLYDEIIDFCDDEGFDCLMVLDTFYYDEATEHVYSTIEVADDPALLAAAAQRNAVPIAEHYASAARSGRFVVEIGNESIGYGGDPNPSNEQYARIVTAFAAAIDAVAPDVEIAVSQDPGPGDDLHGLYSAEVGELVDHVVTHPYGPEAWPGRVALRLEQTGEALDGAGMDHATVMVTEYSYDLYSSEARSWSSGLKQAVIELMMVADPRVAGIQEHLALHTAKVVHSDGETWSVNSIAGGDDRPADERPDLGPRFAMLPSGIVGTLLDRVMQGDLLRHWPGINTDLAGILTSDGETRRLLLVNPTDEAVALSWMGEEIEPTAVLSADAVSEVFSQDEQPSWSIVEDASREQPKELAATSMVLVEWQVVAADTGGAETGEPGEDGIDEDADTGTSSSSATTPVESGCGGCGGSVGWLVFPALLLRRRRRHLHR